MPRRFDQRLPIVAAYALMCGIWGTTWLGIKFSLRYAPPITGAGLRFLTAGAAMYLAAFLLRRTAPARALPWNVIAVFAAFLFGLNYVLTYTAETHVGSGLTAVLFGVLPFFVFAFGHWMLGERTGPLVWFGAALALAGVAVISLTAGSQGATWYALAAVGAAFSSAYANVYAKRHAHHDPFVTLPPSMLISGAAMTALGFLVERPNAAAAFSAPSLAAVVYLALLGSGVAFFLNIWLLQRTAAWIVGLSALIIPVIAVLIGVFAAGEYFGAREIAGAILVIAGVWLALRSS